MRGDADESLAELLRNGIFFVSLLPASRRRQLWGTAPVVAVCAVIARGNMGKVQERKFLPLKVVAFIVFVTAVAAAVPVMYTGVSYCLLAAAVILVWLPRRFRLSPLRRWCLRLPLLCRLAAWLRLVHILQIRGGAIPPDTTAVCVCANCGNVFTGNFCGRCGQGRDAARINFRMLVRLVLMAFTRIANGFKRTVVELVYRPGYMIHDYLRGRRIPYVAPFQTLLLVVAVYMVTLNTVSPPQPDAPVAAAETDGSASVMAEIGRTVESTVEGFDSSISGYTFLHNLWTQLRGWAHENRALAVFYTLPPLTVASILATRRRRTADGYRFNATEHFVIQAYLSALFLVYSMFVVVLHGHSYGMRYDVPLSLRFILYAWAYRGLYGMSWRAGFWCSLKMSLYYFLMVFVVIMAAVLILAPEALP